MRAALTVFLKDLRLEGRSKDVLSTTLFFAGLVVLIMGFAFGPDLSKMRDAAAGVLWCALAFASVLAAGRAWAGEQESGALESLLLYPVAHEWLYLGKAAANALLMLVLGAVTAGLTAIFFDVQFASPGLLALTLVLGVLGLSLVTTFYSAITVNLRAKEALLPVLSFPIIIPVMIGAVKSTVLLTGGFNPDDYWAWTRLLLGFDVVTLLVATFAFPHAVES
ncbi:heme exporter protein CcmB [Deinococcus wulumuqiensis]|uniref:Heme exporter protein B n=1 Tax=Deinococcus wulumuqiensis TaxID=980427 RepID=A0AAV4K5Q5_9DEIO|nr:heme exporter protein CcmB [Deinococcus wulumuqiensis]QII20984.1 heme exporter protein CcmB [Deinococcus wulumuqiensis R12]GGI79715.1 cytochrome c-type biogenesis heme exporter protein B [Deinococcus wulumuqiensis]GGP28989.1 cytochrome c-type biogenesis heme exporter protein B [Deinococcus wulumuqiensis]